MVELQQVNHTVWTMMENIGDIEDRQHIQQILHIVMFLQMKAAFTIHMKFLTINGVADG